jgi:hypothetical protein
MEDIRQKVRSKMYLFADEIFMQSTVWVKYNKYTNRNK